MVCYRLRCTWAGVRHEMKLPSKSLYLWAQRRLQNAATKAEVGAVLKAVRAKRRQQQATHISRTNRNNAFLRWAPQQTTPATNRTLFNSQLQLTGYSATDFRNAGYDAGELCYIKHLLPLTDAED